MHIESSSISVFFLFVHTLRIIFLPILAKVEPKKEVTVERQTYRQANSNFSCSIWLFEFSLNVHWLMHELKRFNQVLNMQFGVCTKEL